MNRLRTLAAIAGMACLLAAEPAAAEEETLIAPGVGFVIPPPSAFSGSIDVLQLVTARHEHDEFTFEGRLSIQPDRFLLVSMDGTGRRMMTIQWGGGSITAERAPEIPPDLKPENVVADITLLFWPEAAVRKGLAVSGATLTVAPGRRTVSFNGRDIVQIRYDGSDPWSGVSHLRNDVWQYDLEIHSQRLAP